MLPRLTPIERNECDQSHVVIVVLYLVLGIPVGFNFDHAYIQWTRFIERRERHRRANSTVARAPDFTETSRGSGQQN